MLISLYPAKDPATALYTIARLPNRYNPTHVLIECITEEEKQCLVKTGMPAESFKYLSQTGNITYFTKMYLSGNLSTPYEKGVYQLQLPIQSLADKDKVNGIIQILSKTLLNVRVQPDVLATLEQPAHTAALNEQKYLPAEPGKSSPRSVPSSLCTPPRPASPSLKPLASSLLPATSQLTPPQIAS